MTEPILGKKDTNMEQEGCNAVHSWIADGLLHLNIKL